jgi:predicted phage terminase large subunit-like protein
VQEFSPSKSTGDKYARLNAVADIFRSGLVWYPAGRKWAEEVVEQVAAFPFGDGDDIVDTTSMAMARFRNGGFIRLPSDEQDEPMYRRRKEYY